MANSTSELNMEPEEAAGTLPDPVLTGPGSVRHAGLDPDSEQWVRALQSEGSRYEEACTRLHEVLLRIARFEIGRRATHNVAGPEQDDLAHQAAADALLAITRKIGQFRGESKFTTWAFTFVVFEVSTKLGRHFWRMPGVTLANEEWDRLPDRFGADPGAETEARELLASLRAAVNDVLTDHQRRVFVALVVNGVPLDAQVDKLGTNRNAVYKTMFDARSRLRARLTALGYLNKNTSRPS
ncbi:RNA polymerase sigma factor [Streptomyces sp. NPDC046900]|uniref:RNA polymerase sigma factor n=1 Tax=Streptomyces sp. NPDC046900 TaxID=3155473 RepID=UPI0033D9ED16